MRNLMCASAALLFCSLAAAVASGYEADSPNLTLPGEM